MISKEQLEKFKTLYKKHFKNDISDQEALDKGIRLVRLIELIYKPMTESEYNRLQKRREETKNK